MAEVVHREADPLIAHPDRLIELVKQYGDEPRLPIVAVDDVRTLSGLQQELERRLAEEGKAVRIVMRAVDVAAVKEAVR